MSEHEKELWELIGFLKGSISTLAEMAGVTRPEAAAREVARTDARVQNVRRVLYRKTDPDLDPRLQLEVI